MKIPIFKLGYDSQFKERFLEGASLILDSGFVGEGKFVKEFEGKFASLSKSKNAIACTSGTDALELAIRGLGIEEGEIIIPSNTFFATSVAVKNCGCDLVLADCCSDDLSIDPTSVERLISPRTKAVITVHIGGIISDRIGVLKEICDSRNIPLIEDAAHAHCSYSRHGNAGTIGDVGCFSFFPTKVMTTGEGGMVTTDNDELADKIRSLKNFGRDEKDQSRCINSNGMNSKINEFTGLFGSLDCDRVISRIDKRNLLLDEYDKNLDKSKYKLVKQQDGYCSYYKCIVITDNAEKVKNVLRENNVSPTGEVYSNPVHHQEVFNSVNNHLGNTDWVAENHICPPLYPELSVEEVVGICKIMNGVEND